MEEENKLIEERREKLKALRAQGQAFPNDWRPAHHAADLARRYGGLDKAALEKEGAKVSIAGRMMLKRVMGKASFATLQDASARLQVYVANDVAGEAAHEAFKHWDLGDIVGVQGTLFKTNKGELTVNAEKLRLLVKALRPLPEKFHGLTDHEQRYRQRYVDLIVSDAARESAVAMAKGYVGEAAVFVTGEDIQIHGGVGFTWDCDAHFYFKRAKQNDVMLSLIHI